jgi:hypothetical protein
MVFSLVLACGKRPEPAPVDSCAGGCAEGLVCCLDRCTSIGLDLPFAVADADGAALVGTTVYLRVAVRGAAPSSVVLALDGTPVRQAQPGALVLLDSAPWNAGDHVVSATANFTSGDPLVAERRIRLDRVLPAIAWEPPPGERSLVGIAEVVAIASEPLHPATSAADVFVAGHPADPPLPPSVVDVAAAAGRVTVRFDRPLDFANRLRINARLADRAGNGSMVDVLWDQPPLAVSLPGGDVTTNGVALFGVAVAPGAAEHVVLVLDDHVSTSPIVRVVDDTAPWSFAVDTRAMEEADWEVVALAVRGGSTFSSGPVRLVVDRTPPWVPRCGPLTSPATGAYWDEPLEVVFSEPVDGAALESAIEVDGAETGPRPRTLLPSASGASVLVYADRDPSGHETLRVGAVPDRAGNLSASEACAVDFPVWQTPGAGPLVTGGPGGDRAPRLALGEEVPGLGHQPVVLALSGIWAEAWTLHGSSWGYGVPIPSWQTASAAVEAAALALPADGVPIAAWVALENSIRHVRAGRETTADWSGLGGILNVDPAADARDPAIASGPGDALAVAWVEDGPGGGPAGLQVRRWEGGAWLEHAPGAGALNADPGSSAAAPALRLDQAGLPVVAWREERGASGHAVFVRRFDGAAWSPPLGGALAGPIGAPSAPSLAIAAAGMPIVAWAEPDAGGTDRVSVQAWDGGAWAPIGNPDTLLPGGARSPSMATGPDGTPFLAVVAPGGPVDVVRVLRWDGLEWIAMDGALNVDPAASAADPSLAVDPKGRPAVAWQEGFRIRFRRYNR